jgi:predicted alpha/beta-hydrolase family hydrolase
MTALLPLSHRSPVKVEIDTPHGPALAHLHEAAEPAGALLLGHGAGGGFGAKDLVAATGAALEASVTTVHVEQPYLVAGRRSPAPAKQLDAAWTAVVEHLRGAELSDLPLVAGGRSAGARVACRTAAETGAVAVLCLAFPVHAPGRPEKTRLDELDAVQVPVLVVQGDSDPFGMPPPAPGREVVTLPGNHSLKNDLPALATAVRDWLPGVLR